MPALYRRHDPASQTRYQDVKRLALSQERVLTGTPGTLKQRTQSGRQYWVREYIRIDGKKTDQYIGPVASVSKSTVEAAKAHIELSRALAAGSASLRLFGYQRVDRKPAAGLEVLFNHGLIQGGLVIVGSHAYGALLNELGINAPGYKTQDIDVARAQPVSIALPEAFDFQAMLNETGLNLLVPGEKTGDIVPVKELGTHAQAIALLDFLIEDNIPALALSPNQVIPIRVPSAERFVIHKLFSSQSRRGDRGKVRKDLEQATVLAAAIEDETPGRLAQTVRSVPAYAKPAIKRGAAAAAQLAQSVHSAASDVLSRIADGHGVGDRRQPRVVRLRALRDGRHKRSL